MISATPPSRITIRVPFPLWYTHASFLPSARTSPPRLRLLMRLWPSSDGADGENTPSDLYSSSQ